MRSEWWNYILETRDKYIEEDDRDRFNKLKWQPWECNTAINNVIVERLGRDPVAPMRVSHDFVASDANLNTPVQALEIATHKPVGATVTRVTDEYARAIDYLWSDVAGLDFWAMLRGYRNPEAEAVVDLIVESGTLTPPFAADVIKTDGGYFAPAVLGSVHVNLTLPMPSSATEKRFVETHVRAAMAIQWVTPLATVVLGCPHPFHPLDPETFPALSLRHQAEYLATIVGTDLRENDPPRFPMSRMGRDVDSLDMCLDRDIACVAAYRRFLLDAISRAKSRTPRWLFDLLESENPIARSVVAKRFEMSTDEPIEVNDFRRDTRGRSGRFGFEFRSPDMLSPVDLGEYIRLLIYACDASADWTDAQAVSAGFNAARSSEFSSFLESACERGSRALMTEEYARALRRTLGAKTVRAGQTAAEAIRAIAYDLHAREKKPFSKHMAPGEDHPDPPRIPDVNSDALIFYENQLTKKSKDRA